MEKRLNVCLLNDSFPPKIDGVANVVLNYARVLHGGLGAVCVATPHYPGVCDDYPFPVIRHPSIKTPRTAGYRTGLPYPARTVREIAKYKPDVIHCHCPFISAILAKSLKAVTGAPIIFTYHTKFDIDIANNIDSGLVQSAAKKLIVSNIEACDEVWAVSRGAGENLRSLGYEGGYRIMENGVDFPKGRVSEEARSKLFMELGLDADIPVFLFVGRMMWYKGIRTIIDGLFRAKAAGVGFKMIFVGGGADYDEITNYAYRLKMNNECIFTGPICDREKLRAYFSLADMFLFPSDFDTNGIVVREAASCGLASVLLRGSAAAESVTDGQNGVLFGGEPEELGNIIGVLAENRELAKEMGRRAMDELYLSWDDAVLNAYRRYHEVLEQHSSAKSRRVTIKRPRAQGYKG